MVSSSCSFIVPPPLVFPQHLVFVSNAGTKKKG